MFGVCGTSWVGTAAADAPPTSEKVSPAAPNTGTDFITRFRFEDCFTFGMLAFLHTCKTMSRVPPAKSTLQRCTMQGWLRTVK